MSASVGIVGFRGYSGAELVRILERHPHAEPVLMEHRSDSAAAPLPRGARRQRTIACTADAVTDRGSERRIPRHAAGSVDGTDAGAARRRREGHRPQRRFPTAHVPRTTSAGIRRSTRQPTCSPKRPTGCPNSAASACAARDWSRIPAAIRRPPISPSAARRRPA